MDPQAFYFGPTEYQSAISPGAWAWGLVNGLQVKVHTAAVLSTQSIMDAVPYLLQPEDPDRLYPGGHYMPFPLSVVNILGNGDFSVQIHEER